MADLAGANLYFSQRLNSQAWDSASQIDREKALATAERQLEPYRDRVDATRFSYAMYEQAIWLLTGDKRAELQQAGVIHANIGSLTEIYKPRHDPAIAPQAWYFLRGPVLKAGNLR